MIKTTEFSRSFFVEYKRKEALNLLLHQTTKNRVYLKLHKKRVLAKLLKPFIFLAQRRGFVPLAARPAKRLSIVCFALDYFVELRWCGKMLALARSSHPQILFKIRNTQEKGREKSRPFSWRREEDLNLRYVSGVHTISNRAP